ncbi:MAG TPA: MASE1 domain-containing protein, partial [Nitrospiria bacterium]
MAHFLKNLSVMAVLAVVYFVSAKLGLMLAFVHPSATPVWPPAGIALAAFLLLGYRVWPAIFLGALLANAATAGSVATSIGIGAGNTLEGLLGAYLVNRFAGGPGAFDRPRDIFRFAFFAGLVSTMVSATFGVTSLTLGGFANRADYGSIWLTWWLGDAAGDLVVAPLIILWRSGSPLQWTRERIYEAAALLGCLVLVGLIVFGGFFPSDIKNYPLEFACFPFLVWMAYRFGQREAATGVFMLSGVAIWGTLLGFGPFVRETPNESLLLLQAFMGVIAVMINAMAAIISGQKRAEEALRTSERRLAGALDIAEAAVISVDETQRMILFDPNAEKIFGYTAQEVLGQSLDLLLPSRFTETHQKHIREFSAGVDAARRMDERREVYGRRKDGTEFPAEAAIFKLNQMGRTVFTAVLRDITERKAHTAALEFQAMHDVLTGLPNRILLQDRLKQAILAASRESEPVTLFVLDLDRFKEVNDTQGHHAGDLLLRQIGRCLQSTLRESDTVARLGGDEFAVVLPNVDLEGATLIAQKMLDLLETPFSL